MATAVKATLLLIFLSFLGCSSETAKDQLSCQNSDWYEIGRRDGASGSPLDRLKGYRRDCGQQWNDQTEKIYRNGRNAGLVEYCTGRNGFELGRMNVSYNAVCPSTMERDFLDSYRKGEEARTLEDEKQRLTNRIDELSQELAEPTDMTDSEKNELKSELSDLKRQLGENEQQLNQISR